MKKIKYLPRYVNLKKYYSVVILMNPAEVDIRLQKLNEEKKKIVQSINVIQHYIKEQETPMPYFQSVADKFKVYQEKRDDVDDALRSYLDALYKDLKNQDTEQYNDTTKAKIKYSLDKIQHIMDNIKKV